jgi:succinate-semialdehyde dehydrogenase/glutarate-semialdehyde dehydrogenase
MTASLFIDGAWTEGSGKRRGKVLNPATGQQTGEVPFVEEADLDRALAAAEKGFGVWKAMSPLERSKIMRKAADHMRERHETIARAITAEQGKPIAEARIEAALAPEHTEWNAEEGRRAYGRLIPARSSDVTQISLREPIGPVAAFSPWNFPVNQVVRKIVSSLAAGCSIIVKAPEETPTCAVELVKCFEEAGVPAGVVNLVFGMPAETSEKLIASPIIQKVSFTGSVPVGRHLGALAAQHLKPTTLELGGHAPFIVTEDVDAIAVAGAATASKFRNAGQVCISPTRFLVHEKVFDQFLDAFTEKAEAIKVGDGMAEETQMGPLAQARRVEGVDALIQDAAANGATIRTGGRRIGNQGFFYAPTILANVPLSARIMNEEPFGPVAIVNRVSSLDEALTEARRLPFALASYAFTNSLSAADRIANEIEAGMNTINHFGLGVPETPFGGFKDSGHGSEGGTEGLEAYLRTKFVTRKR